MANEIPANVKPSVREAGPLRRQLKDNGYAVLGKGDQVDLTVVTRSRGETSSRFHTHRLGVVGLTRPVEAAYVGNSYVPGEAYEEVLFIPDSETVRSIPKGLALLREELNYLGHKESDQGLTYTELITKHNLTREIDAVRGRQNAAETMEAQRFVRTRVPIPDLGISPIHPERVTTVILTLHTTRPFEPPTGRT